MTGDLLLASTRERPEKPISALHGTVPTTTQKAPAQNVHGAEMEKPGSMLINFTFKSNNRGLTYLHFCAILCNKKKLYFPKKGKTGQEG